MLYLKLIELENWVKAQSLSLLGKIHVITEVKSPILFKIIDKKNKESVVYLDRIKLCKDLQHGVLMCSMARRHGTHYILFKEY